MLPTESRDRPRYGRTWPAFGVFVGDNITLCLFTCYKIINYKTADNSMRKKNSAREIPCAAAGAARGSNDPDTAQLIRTAGGGARTTSTGYFSRAVFLSHAVVGCLGAHSPLSFGSAPAACRRCQGHWQQLYRRSELSDWLGGYVPGDTLGQHQPQAAARCPDVA